MRIACRTLLSAVIALAFCAPAAAAKRDCQFPQDPSGPGNFFEPAAWPARLAPSYFARPGIVRPSHDHFYLFIAWRALAALPLAPQAQERLAPFDPCWRSEANGHGGYQSAAAPALVAARKMWDARRLAAGAPKPRTEGTSEEPNCHADAFRNAARTLEARIASHGNGAEVRAWIAAQDAVFAICTGDSPIPPDAAADAPAWLRQDRAYQQAAAALYKGAYADAARRFDLIAADPQSPWRTSAPYLAARADIRSAAGDEPDAGGLERARARLAPLAGAGEASALRSDARRLLQLVDLKSRPKELLAQLDAQLSAAELPESIGQDVHDFAPAYYAGGGRERRELAFASWLSAMRGTGANAEQAAQLWRDSGQGAWLVAALTLATSDTPGLAQLLDAAAGIAPDAAAWHSARYHMARLSPDAAAMKIADAMPYAAMRTEDTNAMRRAALPHAATLADVARYLPRLNAMPDTGGVLPNVDIDGANLLNTGLTLDMLAAISRMPPLPAPLRRELATVAWTRAFVLERPEVMTRLAPDIKAIFPAAAPLVDGMLKETDPVRRRGAAAMLLARFPGMVGNVRAVLIDDTAADAYAHVQMHSQTSRDSERVNWWCDFPEGSAATRKEILAVTPRFLTKEQRRVLAAERATLARTPNATDYLARLVMQHAEREPGDERLPEALSRLIRGHGGCSQGEFTRAMFEHLHTHFKRTAAAKRTPTHR